MPKHSQVTTDCHHPTEQIFVEYYGNGQMSDMIVIDCHECGVQCVVDATRLMLAWEVAGRPPPRSFNATPTLRQELFRTCHPSKPYAPHGWPAG